MPSPPPRVARWLPDAGGTGAATGEARAAELALANRYLLALAAVAVTSAPLAAAALRGLARPW